MLKGTQWKLSMQFPDQSWDYEPQIDDFLSDFNCLDASVTHDNKDYNRDRPEASKLKSSWKMGKTHFIRQSHML